jgi:serine/threonine protein kinase
VTASKQRAIIEQHSLSDLRTIKELTQLGRNSWQLVTTCKQGNRRNHVVKVALTAREQAFLREEYQWLVILDKASDSQLSVNEQALLLKRDFIGGNNLAQQLRQVISLKQSKMALRKCMHQLAQKLEQLHYSNCVHSDLKPSNIICQNTPGQVDITPIIIDFASAQKVGTNLANLKYYSYSKSYSLAQHSSLIQHSDPVQDWFSYFVIYYILEFHQLPIIHWDQQQPMLVFEPLLSSVSNACEYYKSLNHHYHQLHSALELF